MKRREISCDSSSIIALSSNCLLWVLGKFEADFVIPPYVKKEIFDHPVNTKKFGWEAMRNGSYIGKVLKVYETDVHLRDKIINLSNRLLFAENRPIRIIHYGEADAIALALKRGIKHLLVDEKNTRYLIEDVEALKNAVERRLNRRIEINEEVLRKLQKMLSGLKVIRSTEIMAVAIKRGIIKWPYSKKELMRNVLYALKFSGCAITDDEIVELINSI